MEILNYINGQLQPALNGGWLDNYEPATGQVYGRLPDSGAEDVAAATIAAKAAFPGWAKTPVGERARLLSRLADLIERDLDKLAAAESRDQGKPVALATRMDIPRAVDNFRFSPRPSNILPANRTTPMAPLSIIRFANP